MRIPLFMKKFLCMATALALSATLVPAQEAQPPLLGILVRTLAATDSASTQLNVLRGMNAALKGKRQVQAPEEWSALYEKLSQSGDADVRREAQALAAIFGGGGALDELRKVLADGSADLAMRRSALDSLVNAGDGATLALLLKITQEAGALRVPALRALAQYADEAIPQKILQLYPSLTTEERQAALSTLLGRAAWAHGLLEAIDEKKVARTDLTAPLARQLQSFKDARIDQWLTKNWGSVRASSEAHQATIQHFKTFLTPASFETADPARGRAYFAQLCMTCHALFGSGGAVGPTLTGAYTDVDYLLQNIIDPNAIIGKDYQQTTIRTKSGQFLTGIVSSEDASAVTLKTLADVANVQRDDIAELTVGTLSMMPEGLLSAMADDEIRDLFAYLQQHGQIPMLVTENNVNDFFSGVDLKTWHRSSAAWQVEHGVLVGRGQAKTPEFLTSDMVAGNFRLTAQIRVTGDQAVAEIAFRGQERDGTFEGAALSFGGAESVDLVKYPRAAAPGKTPTPFRIPTGEWTRIQLIARGDAVELSVGEGDPIAIQGIPGEPRSVIAFHVLGAGAEVRIKDLALELLPR